MYVCDRQYNLLMFRIKNIRNSTVAKQTQLSPSLVKKTANIRDGKTEMKAESKNKSIVPANGIKKNIVVKQTAQRVEHKLVIPKTTHKLTLFNKVPPAGLSGGKKIASSDLVQKQLNHKNGEKGGLVQQIQSNDPELKQELQSEPNKLEINAQPRETQQNVDHKKIEEKHEEIENLHMGNKKQKEADQKDKKKSESQQIKVLEQRQKEQEEKERQRMKQRQKEAQRERELKEMMEKIQALRRAREEEKEKRKKMQQMLNYEQAQFQRPESTVKGVVSLSDSLGHIEMSQAIMDRQIQMLIKMKFAGYSNKQAIERQVEELQRINRSYLLVRTDPSNPLGSGLANFRIQLFNRVGELVVAGQRQMGSSASGLRIIEADSYTTGGLKDVKVVRGMEGHVKRVLKAKRIDKTQECAICLNRIQKNEEVYDIRCGHLFHLNCLQEWLNSTANCPSCRYNIKFDHY